MDEEKLIPIDGVRRRPEMYVGDTGTGGGILQMLLEVLANSVDQHLAGRCSRVSIEIEADGSITVSDDGPGIAAEGGDGLPPIHELLTVLSTRPTVDGHRPHVHLGLGGLGLFIVNALSERFELHSVRDGKLTTAVYSRGEVVEPLDSTPTQDRSGTRIRFRPDPEIFRHLRVPRVELARELEDLSFLAPRLALHWTIAGDHTAAGGLAARVALGARCDVQDVATHAETYETPNGPIDVDVALAFYPSKWGRARDAEIESFVNLRQTRDHGCHVDGLLAGVRAFFGARKRKHFAGLVAAVSVVLTDVKYGEPTASRLATAEAAPPVTAAVKAALEAWARARPELAADARALVSAR